LHSITALRLFGADGWRPQAQRAWGWFVAVCRAENSKHKTYKKSVFLKNQLLQIKVVRNIAGCVGKRT
jgi:hypothetical protein